MPISRQSLQYLDVPLSVGSQPAGSLSQLDMPFAKRVYVKAKDGRYTLTVNRALVDATRGGRSYTRSAGGRHSRVRTSDPTQLTGLCIEHSPAFDLDYGTIARAQDPLQPELTASRVVTKIGMLERYAAVVSLLTTAANWDAGATSTLAGLGNGASGVQLSDPASLPFVDLAIGSGLAADNNDGIPPHFCVMNVVAARYMAAKGARTSIPVDKTAVRELTIPELQEALGQHLGCDVFVETAREAGTLLWGNQIVFGYYPTDMIPTEGGAEVPPSTMVLIHEEIPEMGIRGEMAIKRKENEEATGLMIASMSSWSAQKVDDKAIFLITACY